MAVILSNKYQSKNRDNFRKITGLSEANEKIKPENMPRIYGGVGEVYFEGQSPAGSSTGNGGGDTGIIDPNGSNGSNGSNSGGGDAGGGDAGGGDAGDTGFNGECECVEVSTDGGCCISGKDCETGNPIKIQLNPSDDPIISCDAAPNPSTDPLGYVIIVYPYPSGNNCKNILLFPSGDIQGAFDAGVTAGGMCLVNSVNNQEIDTCPYINWINVGDKINITTKSINTPQGYIQYTDYRKWYAWDCGSWRVTGSSSASLRIETNPNSKSYKDAVNAYNKTKSKNYFIKNGKFFDVCDPYGTPPSSEPIIMCDENGNQYEVSPDSKIKAL